QGRGAPCGILASIGAWRSLVARTVRVGEVPGSNPGAPIWRHLHAARCVVVEEAVRCTVLLHTPCERRPSAAPNRGAFGALDWVRSAEGVRHLFTVGLGDVRTRRRSGACAALVR